MSQELNMLHMQWKEGGEMLYVYFICLFIYGAGPHTREASALPLSRSPQRVDFIREKLCQCVHV